MKSKAINAELYAGLKRVYGRVDVSAEGQPIRWKLVRDLLSRNSKYQWKRKIVESGEEYHINCPFCGDTRMRLTINHRWGVWDPETNSRNLFLAQCYNERCLSDPDRREQLCNAAYSFGRPRSRLRSVVADDSQDGPVVVEPPGLLVSLEELAARQPGHEAVTYLQSRGYDPAKLSRVYDVSWCCDSRWRLARNRIIIPIYMDGALVGWQARYPADQVAGKSLKELGILKYWSCPTMKRRYLLYNLDRALQCRTVCVVEGMADTWGILGRGVGVIGKTISPYQRRLLVSSIRKRYGDNATIVLLLDPDQDAKARERGDLHHISKAYRDLKNCGLPVLPVYLPAGTDPGSLASEFTFAYIRAEAKKHGIAVDFRRHK